MDIIQALNEVQKAEKGILSLRQEFSVVFQAAVVLAENLEVSNSMITSDMNVCDLFLNSKLRELKTSIWSS